MVRTSTVVLSAVAFSVAPTLAVPIFRSNDEFGLARPLRQHDSPSGSVRRDVDEWHIARRQVNEGSMQSGIPPPDLAQSFIPPGGPSLSGPFHHHHHHAHPHPRDVEANAGPEMVPRDVEEEGQMFARRSMEDPAQLGSSQLGPQLGLSQLGPQLGPAQLGSSPLAASQHHHHHHHHRHHLGNVEANTNSGISRDDEDALRIPSTLSPYSPSRYPSLPLHSSSESFSSPHEEADERHGPAGRRPIDDHVLTAREIDGLN